MKNKSLQVLILVAIATFSSSCLSTKLPERDRDMTEQELHYYKIGGQFNNFIINSNKTSIPGKEFRTHNFYNNAVLEDKSAWFPLVNLAFSDVKVANATSDTEFGFKANLFNCYGPLALIRAIAEESTYDSQGKLQTYESGSGYLWSILYGRDYLQKKESDKWQTETANSFLFGLYKYTSRSNSDDTMRILYIPFDISK